MRSFKLKLKTKRSPKLLHIRFDIEKLKYPEVEEFFQTLVDGRFAALKLLKSETDTLTFDIKEFLLTMAEGVLGKSRKKSQLWIAKGNLNLCDKRRVVKKYSSYETQTRYKRTFTER